MTTPPASTTADADAVARAYTRLSDFLRARGERDGARDALERAVTERADDPQRHFALAHFLERCNLVDAAGVAAAEGLRLAPRHPELSLVMARVDRRRGRLADALSTLERIDVPGLPSRVARAITFERGHVRDGLEDVDGAWADYVAGNALAAAEVRALRIDPERFLARAFPDPDEWAPSAAAGPDAGGQPVFLVGFPRSGTTLIEQILDSHPDIHTLSEIPAVQALHDDVAARADGQTVLDVSPVDAERLRAQYWHTIGGGPGMSTARVVIDKLPLNIVHLPLIHRVFPGARILFAQRHPLDVCLSCFTQDFELNAAMANFTSLEATAQLYARVMAIWQTYATRCAPQVHVIRYERLVTDFESEVRMALDFLGVGWHDGVRDFAAHARARGEIQTPSYHQVVQPLHDRSIGRWRPYARHLAGVRDRLVPIAESFGYTDAWSGA